MILPMATRKVSEVRILAPARRLRGEVAPAVRSGTSYPGDVQS